MNDPSDVNYRKLVDTFSAGKFVSFIGAGPSMPTGIPDWDEMLQGLIAHKDLDLSIGDYEGEYRYQELASDIYKRYEELSCGEEFYDYLVSITEPTQTSCTGVHYRVIDAISVHITTNFDCALEKAYELHKEGTIPSYQYFPHFNIDDLVDHSIVYLHANRNKKRFVFRKEEFDFYYPSVSRVQGSNQIESFLRHVFKNRHILFIGCSFNDPYLRHCLEAISKQIALETKMEESLFGRSLGSANISHYALLPARRLDNRPGLIEELEGYHIHTICYQTHYEIEGMLKNLRDLKRTVPVTSDYQAGGSDSRSWG